MYGPSFSNVLKLYWICATRTDENTVVILSGADIPCLDSGYLEGRFRDEDTEFYHYQDFFFNRAAVKMNSGMFCRANLLRGLYTLKRGGGIKITIPQSKCSVKILYFQF